MELRLSLIDNVSLDTVTGIRPEYDHPASRTDARPVGDNGPMYLPAYEAPAAASRRSAGRLAAPHQASESAERIVCHCLHVSQTEVELAAASGLGCALKDVMECTGAGTGCTACHHRIRQILQAEGRQSPEPSPICIAR